jgi:hypothetical protein
MRHPWREENSLVVQFSGPRLGATCSERASFTVKTLGHTAVMAGVQHSKMARRLNDDSAQKEWAKC